MKIMDRNETKVLLDLENVESLVDANLSGANLKGTEGVFYFNYGVKLEVKD